MISWNCLSLIFAPALTFTQFLNMSLNPTFFLCTFNQSWQSDVLSVCVLLYVLLILINYYLFKNCLPCSFHALALITTPGVQVYGFFFSTNHNSVLSNYSSYVIFYVPWEKPLVVNHSSYPITCSAIGCTTSMKSSAGPLQHHHQPLQDWRNSWSIWLQPNQPVQTEKLISAVIVRH